MKLSLNFLFLGWWLARQCWTSRAQTPSKPSISISPSGMVAVGKEVTIFCRSKDDFHGYFNLIRYENSFDEEKPAGLSQAAFSLANLSPADGGIYRCRSCLSQCSPFSDKIYLNLTDPILTKPSIWIRKEEEVAPEAYVSIRCKDTKLDLAFALLRSGEQIAYKAAKPDKNSVDFLLHQMMLEKPQSYTCQYHNKSSPFVWSEPSDPLQLPWGGDLSPYMWGGIAASLFLLLTLLLLAFVYWKKRRKSSITSEDNQAVSVSLRSDAGEPLDEVSYATLNHQPQKIQQATSPSKDSEPCLYATVAKNETTKKQ